MILQNEVKEQFRPEEGMPPAVVQNFKLVVILKIVYFEIKNKNLWPLKINFFCTVSIINRYIHPKLFGQRGSELLLFIRVVLEDTL